jgi:hypothetical protein
MAHLMSKLLLVLRLVRPLLQLSGRSADARRENEGQRGCRDHNLAD